MSVQAKPVELMGLARRRGVQACCAAWRRSRMPANSFACPGALAQTRCDRTVRVLEGIAAELCRKLQDG